MAYFAKINEENVVQQVITVPNYICGKSYPKSEINGIKYLNKMGYGTNWLQVWSDGGIRKKFPSKGFIYKEEWNQFIPPKPYPSWILDGETHKWVAPVPYPNDGYYYEWDEEILNWVRVDD